MRCGESSAFSFLVRWFLSLHSIKMQFAIRRKNRTAMFINSWGFRRRRAADFTPRFKAPAVIDVILIRHENHFFLRFSLNYFSFLHKSTSTANPHDFQLLLNVDINFAVVIKKNSLPFHISSPWLRNAKFQAQVWMQSDCWQASDESTGWKCLQPVITAMSHIEILIRAIAT